MLMEATNKQTGVEHHLYVYDLLWAARKVSLHIDDYCYIHALFLH